MSYTIKNLDATTDSAERFGLSEIGEAHFASKELGATSTGFSYHVLKPDKRQAFGHRHENAEEVYVVLDGDGRIRLDEEIREISRHDAIRVAPPVVRALEAGPEGMSVLVFGAHHEGDGELLHEFWTD
jgi:mannose-6-phosphate isomerase-like protein (cupin superfamily)